MVNLLNPLQQVNKNIEKKLHLEKGCHTQSFVVTSSFSDY